MALCPQTLKGKVSMKKIDTTTVQRGRKEAVLGHMMLTPLFNVAGRKPPTR
jgi:hypothetical protein